MRRWGDLGRRGRVGIGVALTFLLLVAMALIGLLVDGPMAIVLLFGSIFVWSRLAGLFARPG